MYFCNKITPMNCVHYVAVIFSSCMCTVATVGSISH